MDRKESDVNHSPPLLTSSYSEQEHVDEPTNPGNEESISRSQGHQGVAPSSQGNVNVEEGSAGESTTAIPEDDVEVGSPRSFIQGESSAPLPSSNAAIDLSSLVFHPGATTKSGEKSTTTRKYKGLRIGNKEGLPKSQVIQHPRCKPSKPLPDRNRLPPTCYECNKEFSSWKAVHGHMRTHPEREWRGTVPPPNVAPAISIVDDNRGPPLAATDQDVVETAARLLLSIADNGGVPVASANNLQEEEPHREADVTENSALSSNARYECSVCKKVFPSHQALGGHRASHKSVKGCFSMDNTAVDETSQRNGGNYGCEICSRVFATGQALGGHMRVHTEEAMSGQGANVDSTSLARTGLVLDLNHPPPPYLLTESDENSSSSSSSSRRTSLDLHL